MNLYSHPGKLLIDHLREVADNCYQTINGLKLFKDDPLRKQVLLNLAFIAGAFHDLGKGTRFFQHYLLPPLHEITGPKSHALISALFVKEISKEYLSKTALSEFDQELFAHLAFTAVKRHHGRLENFEDELDINLHNNFHSKELQQQIVAFEEEAIEKIIVAFTSGLALTYNFQNFKKYILSKAHESDMPDFYDAYFTDGDYSGLKSFEKIEYYYFHQLLFSSLLLSDKTDVIIGKDAVPENAPSSTGTVSAYRKEKGFDNPESEIDQRKNEAYKEALSNLQKVFSPEQSIYSLTLPTGLGKTITSFAVAQKIKEMLGTDCKRIIITIPFTSIIDQNFEVYSRIVNSKNSDALLKHHHLAEPSYKVNDDELTPDKSQFLIETWQSGIVVTTFVQLLNSLFSNDKSLLIKLPNLANSIIILDEVQTIPYEYWQLVKRVFEVLGKAYGCYFILMTATQPMMFLPELESKEIIPDYKKYFGYFNRTKLFNRTQKPISFSEFTELVSLYFEENKSKDILIILNTKKHSKQCFEALRNLIDTEAEDIYYLSTLITPYERKRIINLIKQKSTRRKIVVSTQLIEAGVDISVDTVFRAMAPLDSIIQAAGRGNRYGEKEHQAEIYLYEIAEMKKATSIVYGADLIQKTKNVLQHIDVISEDAYLPLIEKYFHEVRKQSDNYFCKYLDGIYGINFKDVGEFSLIEERKAESVFLQLNEDAKDVWEQYITIYQHPSTSIFQKRQAFSKIKSRFYDFVINVPVPRDKKSIDFDGVQVFGFYLSHVEQPSRFYHYDEQDFTQNTGYEEVNTLSF